MADRRVVVILGADVAGYVSGVKTAADQTIRLVGTLDSAGSSSTKAADAVTQSTERMRGGFSRSALAASLMSGSLAQVAQVATGFFAGQLFVRGIDAISAGIKNVVTSGIALNETLNVTSQSFGTSASVITAGADDMARRFGIVKEQFLQGADAVGLIGKAAGLAAPGAAQLGVHFEKLAADVASFYHVPVADALDAIESGLVGQERPLRQYGVLLDEATVKQEAVRLGLIKQGQALTEGEAVMARASLITKGFGDAQGDLARTQDQLANRLREIRGDVQNWAADLGLRAQPAIISLIDAAGQLGSGALAVLHTASVGLAPVWHDLVTVGRDLGQILVQSSHAAGPLVVALAAIAATGIFAALRTIVGGLRDFTDLLAHNRVALEAFAVVLGVALVPRLIEAATAFRAFLTLQATEALYGTIGALGTFTTALGGVPAVVGGAVIAVQLLGNVLDKVFNRQPDVKGLTNALLDLAAGAGNALEEVYTHSKAGEQGLARIGAAIDTLNGKQLTTRNLATYRDAINDLDVSLAGMVKSGAPDAARTALEDLARVMGTTSAQLLASGALNDYQRALGDASMAAKLNAASSKEAGKSANSAGIDFAALGASASAAAGGVAQLSEAQKAVAQGLASFAPLSAALDISTKTTAAGKSAADQAIELAQARLSVEKANLGVIDSQRTLDALQNGGQVHEMVIAQRDLAAANDGTTRSQLALINAQQAYDDLLDRSKSGRSLDELNDALQRARLRKDQADAAVQQARDKLTYAQQVGIPQEVNSTQDDLTGALLDQKEAVYAVTDAQTALNRAQGDNGTIARQVASAQLDVNDAQRGAAGALDAQAASQQKLNDLMNGGLVEEMTKASLDLRDALQGVATAQQHVLDTMQQAAQAKDPTKDHQTTLAEFSANLDKSSRQQRDWFADLSVISERGGGDVITALTAMGSKGFTITHQLATSSASDFEDMRRKITTSSELGSQAFLNAFTTNLTAGRDVSLLLTGDLVSGVAGELDLGVGAVQSTMGQWTDQLVAGINSVRASIGLPPISASGSLPVNLPNEAVAPGQHFKPLPLASGGVMDPHITKQPTILYGERETGQEAFIPQRGGSFTKMKDVLSTAASWYGLGVVPMAAGGLVLPPAPNFASSGTVGNAAAGVAAYDIGLASTFLAGLAARGGGAGAPTGAVPGNVASWISAGLKLRSMGPDWLAGLERLVMAESGGDPHAMNPVGVPNGVNGVEHAEGLAQMLPSTFRAHALAGYSDIWSPVDNIASAIGYIQGRYGSVYNTPLFKGGAYKGYARGGINVLDSGGYIPQGISLTGNFTGRPEFVPHPASTGATSRSLTINGPLVHMEPHIAADADLPAMKRAMESVASEATDRLIARIEDAVKAH